MTDLDTRHKWIATKLSESYGNVGTIAEAAIHEYKSTIDNFFEIDGPQKLIWFFQEPQAGFEGEEEVEVVGDARLFLTTGDVDALTNKAVYFVRTSPKGVFEKSVEQDVAVGEIAEGSLETFRTLLTEVFIPILKQQHSWGKSSEEETKEFIQGAAKFGTILTEAVSSLQGGVELRKPDRKFVEMELKPNTFNKIAQDTDATAHFEAILDDWCLQTEKMLDEGDTPYKVSDNSGPDTEIDFWRNRMAKLNSITEQLKLKDCKLVLGVAMASRLKSNRTWKTIDVRVTDATNEAKDNVKYLNTLEKSLEPLYSGTPHNIIETLPTLMNNIKMMHQIARYYNTVDRMTTLFCKITNQMINNAKQFLLADGKLWDQDKQSLIKNLHIILKVNEAYQEQYKITRDRLMSQPRGKQFDFDERKIFGKFDLFCKRVSKLIDLFTTIQQFSTLAEHKHIDGLEEMVKRFTEIADDFRKLPYDLLEYTRNQFDRDLLEFNVNINELETTLQAFLNSSFEKATSTEHALNLLRQFQSILQRDSLKSDLDEKYMAIFQNYGQDLNTIQQIYEKQKNSPPLVRNAPPVAGSIMWSRQLLQRIEEPMKKFSQNKSIMSSKDSKTKKIIKTYNRVARALIEFETLWHDAWKSSIEFAKAGLQATLIVRHPETNQLLVNFDKEILLLIQETKYLQRLGLQVPDNAKVVLFQEEKFKYYYNQLTYTLKEYDRVVATTLGVTKPLLALHMEVLEKKIQPGMYVLTWTSMNIDGYLQRCQQGINEYEDLVKRVNDCVESRIDVNLKKLSNSYLVNLPTDTLTLHEFTSVQQQFIKESVKKMQTMSSEVQNAIEEILDIIVNEKIDGQDVPLTDENIQAMKDFYSNLMYQAVLAATQRSLDMLKKRLASGISGGFLYVEKPFFDVDVELTVPNVSMNPSLEEIQKTVNMAAKEILKCSRFLKIWARPDENKTYFDLIAADKSIVKSILLLTGSIEGTKIQVADYLETFSTYDTLWKKDMQQEYNEFIKGKPSLEKFEAELKSYMAIEQEIMMIPPVHNIGCLSLETQSLKYSLKAEAAAWKAQYAKNLHSKGFEELNNFNEYIRETRLKLQRKMEDLEDVRYIMDVLREVRNREAEIDSIMTPIEDMYAPLIKYGVQVPKDETDTLNEMNNQWRVLRKQSTDVSEKLHRFQATFKKELVKQVKSFVSEVSVFRNDWESNGPIAPGLDPMDAAERLDKFKSDFSVKKVKWEKYTQGEILFGLPVTQYPELEKTEKEIAGLDKLYSLYVMVVKTFEEYEKCLWVNVVERITEMIDKTNVFAAQCKKLPKALKEWPAFLECKKKVDAFSSLIPTLEMLTNKSIRLRHWKEVMTVSGHQFSLGEEDFKMSDLTNDKVLSCVDEIADIASSSVKEEQIEIKLSQISEEWSDLQFSFVDYKKRGPVILKGSEIAEVIEKLEESQMTLGGMATNRYSQPFRDEVMSWISKLSSVSEVIEQWTTVQNMWLYMEAVFAGGDIARQLPQETKRFQNIDKQFMKIVKQTEESPNIIQTCCGNEMLRDMLPHLLDQLERCQKSLSVYLETKRALFPRFYFVSDPSLLEILSLGSNPTAVQPHFQSGLFDSLTAVTFSDPNTMTHMHSAQGEKVEFSEPVKATGNVESWLQVLVDGMKNSLKDIIKKAYSDVNEQGLEDFIFSHPAQVSLLGTQFQWTADMTTGLMSAKNDKTIMNKTLKKVDATLKEMVLMTTKEMSKMNRKNLETCITVYVHQRDTSEDLIKKKVKEPTDFEWMKNARFTWRESENTVIISICDVDFEYSFEYLGVKERLVITPLTDICYVTLSQALGMFLGGAPAGPAGTGKTETTKDLGNTLGKFVVVFNCSDQMDYKFMGKIYKGLAQSGLWGCFDEFNRIDLEVLSVCAQQVYCVLSAIRDRKKEFVFTDGCKVDLDSRVGYFITMNPGYAGRQELPENLKALFRGVTMMVPNRQIIMKVKLASCGYLENDLLAKKFFVLYGLCEQQLSKQAHYDFGLRNILSVLRTAGASKRAYPDKSESFLMMRTLRDMNMSKMVAEDVPLFLSLLDDLFVGLKAPRAEFPDVYAALCTSAENRGLQKHESWLNKCIQLYETCLVRHGIMLVGPAGAGKSSIIQCLADALSVLEGKHLVWRMNPKAITANQMFGKLDSTSGDWTDGIFSVLWRKASKAKDQNTWIVLDGPVDAIWIENLNTVLDDNKVLTLANGDRIRMSESMKAMFEPENLNNASPATVSRAGIIFVSETELGWKPVVDSWLETRSKSEADALRPCFDKYIDMCVDFIRLNFKQAMTNEVLCQVQTLLDILQACLISAVEHNETYSEGHYERIFLYALAWSIGGLLDSKDRVTFDGMIREKCDNMPVKEMDGDTMYEYYVNEENTEWRHWNELLPTWDYPTDVENPKFGGLVIPTLDSIRYEALLDLNAKVKKSTLLIGVPGTAKTCTINQFIGKFPAEETKNKSITFSCLTTPQIFQMFIENSMEKRQGKTYGPPGGKKMIIFIDDVSMPEINVWGDQVTNELVRQLLEQKGMYNIEKPIGDMKLYVDTHFVAAMVNPGGGKNDIPNRFKRHFCIYNVPEPSMAALDNIFGQLVDGRFDIEHFSEDFVQASKTLVPMTISLWNSVKAKMLPTPAKFHYLFNMRDLSKVFQGLLFANRDRFDKASDGAFQAFGSVTNGTGYLFQLWRHECERVFSDKLVSDSEKAWIREKIDSLIAEKIGSVSSQLTESAYFVDFLRDPIVDEETGDVLDEHPSNYEAINGGVAEMKTLMTDLMIKRNENSKTKFPDLVLFEDALLHLMRVCRILAMDKGSTLLVGIGGSGKQSLTRLGAYAVGATVVQITLTKTYNITNFLEDFRSMYILAGKKGQKVCFLFTDAEIKDEAFLEYMNQFLMTGEVAGLFPKEELDGIIGDMRPIMKKEAPHIPDTNENLSLFFFDRVRDNLHACLCFSPVGPQFASRSQKFPGLINGCTIDWFLPWPTEALISVSKKFIQDFNVHCTPEVKEALVTCMANVHQKVSDTCDDYYNKFRKKRYVTPKSYLSFIGGYKDLYSKKYNEVEELASKVNSGLEKLEEAKKDISLLRSEIITKNEELEVAQKESHKLLGEISESTTVAEKEKKRVEKIMDAVSKKAAEINAVKVDAEHDLAAAKPALDEAVSALNSISAKDIAGLKVLKKPPSIVQRIFDTVLVLRRYPMVPVTWIDDDKAGRMPAVSYETALKMMSDVNFLSSLLNFPKEEINDEDIELLQPYFNMPDFTVEAAYKASGNVSGFCSWARAMAKYQVVAKVVTPKMNALREAEVELKIANKEKATAQENARVVQEKLNEMQATFDAAIQAKDKLAEEALQYQRKMDAANNLLGALGGEEARWTEQSKEFDQQKEKLVGDCALASGFLSYLGPFNKEFRTKLLTDDFLKDLQAKAIPVSADLTITKFLTDEAEIGEWNLQGLPIDELSVQNALIVTRATRYPLLIDPQGQGKAWLTKRNATNSLKITTLGDRGFRIYLEDALTFGKPILIENIEEELDPVLDPILEKQFIKTGKSMKVILPDKEVDYCDTFEIMFTTRLPNATYSPELSAKVSLIDFTVTESGLEDQLLGTLIQKEKSSLQEQRQKLLEDVNFYKKKIKALEDELLFRLSNSSGNLLDDTELVKVLANTKATSAEVAEKLLDANDTNQRITEACEEYRPVAHRATLIYFLISEFSVVNCMYQTSLAQFKELYLKAIDMSEKAALARKRIVNIIDYMTYMIYRYIQRGLFERHKLQFALMLTNKIAVSAGTVAVEAIDIFLKGGGSLDIGSVKKKPKDWIPDKAWLNVVALSSLPSLHDLPDSIAKNDNLWHQWYDMEAPETVNLPDNLEQALSKFEKMCVIKAMREDRTLIAAQAYITENLSSKFIESVPLDMEELYAESNPKCPMIFLLSKGSDPTTLIEELARKHKTQTLGVSMGQGQEVIAKKFITQATQEGYWVILQNTHLKLSYLSEIETFLSSSEQFVHENFRLYITAEPHPQFPLGLLQLGIKVTNEAPVGMKAGLRNSYSWVTQDMLEASMNVAWRQLLAVQCFLHSVVQERRKFGPIGWNIAYEFNQSDLSAITMFLQNHVAEMDVKKSAPNWSTIRYMVSTIQYGGRITDGFDQLLMDTYADKYFNQSSMETNHEFFPGYKISDASDIQIVRQGIEHLPATDSPEIFGLHSNADLSFRVIQVSDMVATILNTMPKVGGATGGLTREEQVDKIAEDLLSKIPSFFKAPDTKEKLKKLGPTQPLTICLRQEIDRLNTTISLTSKTLKNLRLAIAGTIALSGNLIVALDSLFNAQVPEFWLKKSWEAATLGSWFQGLLQRHDQLYKWLNNGRPKGYWMSGFFNPQGFLTAMKQEVARKHVSDNWALDDVVAYSEVTHPPKEFEALREPPAEGVYVYGLYLDGCQWSGKENRLVDSEPKKLFAPLPVLYITGVLAKDKATDGVYDCPVYRSKKRTGLHFITTTTLRTEDPATKWIMRGVALLFTTD